MEPLTDGSKATTTTWSEVVPLAHGPLFTVHKNVLVPMLRPVTVVVGEVGEVMLPLPFTSDHWPVAGNTGTLPVSVAAPGLHTCWSAPALALGLFASYTVTVTSSLVVPGVQGPLLMVQRYTYTPTVRPVMVVFLLDGLVITPPPLIMVHWPLAGATAAFAFMVVLVAGVQMLISGPALAAGWLLL